MKTIITRNGETIRSSCEPREIVYDRHSRTVKIMNPKDKTDVEMFTVIDDRLCWLEADTTGLSEVLAEFAVK